jgi:hypothetical protein
MREDDSDILEYSIIKYQPASFLGLNGYKMIFKQSQDSITLSEHIGAPGNPPKVTTYAPLIRLNLTICDRVKNESRLAWPA